MTLHLRPSASEEPGNTAFRVKPDGAIDPAGETGWFLQRERERVGKTLADAALETQINAKYLHAIEHGVLQDLPSGSYVLGYVRVYAEFLGLDPEPVIEHYKSLLPAGERKQAIAKSGGGSGGVFGLAAASVAFIVGLSAIVWFTLPEALTGDGAKTAAVSEPAPAPTAKTAPDTTGTAPAGTVAPQTPQTAKADPVDREASELDKAVPTVRIKQRGLAEIANENSVAPADSLNASDKTAASPAIPDAEGTGDQTSGLTEFIRQHVTGSIEPEHTGSVPANGEVFGAKDTKSRITLKANQSVWIRVEDEQGNVMITRTLKPGDSYKVPNKRGLVLIARDGGALDYSIDGRQIGTIGATGEIVVGRSLDIDKLRQAGG